MIPSAALPFHHEGEEVPRRCVRRRRRRGGGGGGGGDAVGYAVVGGAAAPMIMTVEVILPPLRLGAVMTTAMAVLGIVKAEEFVDVVVDV
jgi:hypothetical protein